MNKENTKYLYNKYPSLMIQHKLPMSQTCMHWGFECGDGWKDLVDETCAKILELDTDRVIQFLQVKEKFGQLRMYIGVYPYDDHEKKDYRELIDKVYNITNEAETKSATICEICGKPGKLRTSGWLCSLCNECEKDRK